MLGALLGYTLERDVFERLPGGVDHERFIKVFVDSCMASAIGTEEER
jgi:hypothetical protein